MCFNTKIIPNVVLFKKLKSLKYVSSSIVLELHVCNFSLHLTSRVVLKLSVLYVCHKIEHGPNFMLEFFSPHVFTIIVINIQLNEWFRKLAKQ